MGTLDLTNVVIETDNYNRQIGYCPACRGWVCLDNYKGVDRVFRQINHNYPCPKLEEWFDIPVEVRIAPLADMKPDIINTV